jgi:ubiquinone/menaquinone biosynthesis C-methylase UbiE
MNTVESFYDANAQREWERFDRHRMEFAITRRALAQYLPPPPARILDCGGGPGRYAIHLARLGYQVTLLDLSRGNLALAQAKAQEAQAPIAGFVHGNALDLSQFQNGEFDAVLLMGPLYHLISQEERCQAVREALRVTRPGGLIFAAFITQYAVFRDTIAKGYLKDFVDMPHLVENLLACRVETPGDPGFTDAWFADPAGVQPWLESFGLTTLALLAAEGLVAGHEQHINALDPHGFEYWADLNYQFCSDPSLYGAADHLLYVGQM